MLRRAASPPPRSSRWRSASAHTGSHIVDGSCCVRFRIVAKSLMTIGDAIPRLSEHRFPEVSTGASGAARSELCADAIVVPTLVTTAKRSGCPPSA